MRLLRAFTRNRNGSAAIEFAILALPFFVVVFAIAEIAVMYFVDSGLDAALHKAVRQVRVGVAKTGNWDATKYITAISAIAKTTTKNGSARMANSIAALPFRSLVKARRSLMRTLPSERHVAHVPARRHNC